MCLIASSTLAAGASIGDFIWEDTNADGIQDVGETGISDVTVDLTEPGPDGVFDTGDDLMIGTQSTDQTGHYIFTDLGAGTFRINVTDTNSVLNWHVLIGVANPHEVTLSEFQDYMDADFGYKRHQGFIYGFVWDDTDRDGIKGGWESGISGVTVDLVHAGDDGLFDTGDEFLTGTQTTNEYGGYDFIDLRDGIYRVNVTDTNSVLNWHVMTGGTNPHDIDLPVFGEYSDANFGYKRHQGFIYGFVWDDTDGDGIKGDGEGGISNITVDLVYAGDDGLFDTGDEFLTGTQTTNEYGGYDFIDLRDGIYRVNVTDTNSVLNWYVMTGGTNPHDVDLPVFGEYPDANFGYKRHDGVIGGFIWDDMNGDGIKDAGESGISNVTVDLVYAGDDGLFDTGDEFLAGTQTTQGEGTYFFGDLQDGVYQVDVTDTDLVLDGYEQTTETEPLTVTLIQFQQDSDANFGYRLPIDPAAEISEPVPGSALGSTSATLTWNDTGADQYWLWIGTSEGDYDVYSGDQGTNTSVAVANLPANQETLYVRLMSKADGEWFYNDCTYTACDMTAEIQNPAPGSALGSATQTFSWNDSGAAGYWFWIGTSAGDYDVYSGNLGTGTSVTVSELPANGETLYVRLWSSVDGVWIYNTDYTYTACDVMAEILSPAPGSALGSATETFSWNDSGAAGYWFWIGTSAGDYDVYSGNLGTNTSVTVSELPANGETLYVRLWSSVDGV
ncbi:MAG: hypothetical protein GY753_08745, partial [Gammaproteobacteria bacterium]|nr:hypothetical protein [Gammaproteobacteria bacterium]